jgi:hypothetical protein
MTFSSSSLTLFSLCVTLDVAWAQATQRKGKHKGKHKGSHKRTSKPADNRAGQRVLRQAGMVAARCRVRLCWGRVRSTCATSDS